MKTLSLIPDNRAEMISGGFLNTTINQNGKNATQNTGSSGIALLAIGQIRNLRF
jgi:hypothetical protein